MSRVLKIALLGAKGFATATDEVRVDCFPWDQIQKIKNIRDYDTILINLLSIQDKASRNSIDWLEFDRVLDLYSALGILQHGGSIIVVGDPRFSIPKTGPIKVEGKQFAVVEPFLEWTGARFTWDDAPGDTVIFNNDYKHRNFEEYVKKLEKWEYSLAEVHLERNLLEKYFNFTHLKSRGLTVELDEDLFCYNRYKNGLAFILRIQIMSHERTYNGTYSEPLSTFGSMIFLPPINASEEETLTIVLRDLCGVEAELPEPEWLSEYIAPGQNAVEEEIEKIKADFVAVRERYRNALERRDKVRECLKLLYEREKGLEPVVREVLRGLGAHVEDPKEPNKEDGWVTVEVAKRTFHGVLEVKSTSSEQFDEKGIRQLLDWINRGIQLRQKKYKGIFIGNSAVDIPLEKRPWAFSDNFSKSIKLHGMCAMKTEHLYFIHLLRCAGKLNLGQFWKDLFETNGIFDAKPYIQLLTPDDK